VGPIEVDTRGLRCPLPVIRLAEAARDSPAGTKIVVLATDPAARYDIPAWCRMRSHELRELTEVGEQPEVGETSKTAGKPGTGDGQQTAAGTAYLRFVVVVPPQRSNAAGIGSGSERSRRAT